MPLADFPFLDFYVKSSYTNFNLIGWEGYFMETTIRKIGNSVGAIIPSELKAQAGDKYKIVKIGDTLVLTPIRDDLFSNKNDWVGFRDSISKTDREWDEVDN